MQTLDPCTRPPSVRSLGGDESLVRKTQKRWADMCAHTGTAHCGSSTGIASRRARRDAWRVAHLVGHGWFTLHFARSRRSPRPLCSPTHVAKALRLQRQTASTRHRVRLPYLAIDSPPPDRVFTLGRHGAQTRDGGTHSSIPPSRRVCSLPSPMRGGAGARPNRALLVQRAQGPLDSPTSSALGAGGALRQGRPHQAMPLPWQGNRGTGASTPSTRGTRSRTGWSRRTPRTHRSLSTARCRTCTCCRRTGTAPRPEGTAGGTA